MAIVAYNKKDRNDVARLHSEMDDLINSFFSGWNWPTAAERRVWPAMDVSEDENSVMVKAELPGCKAEDIDISVHGNVLSISGEKKHEEEKKDKNYYHIERSYGSFRRDITLPSDVDPAKVDAAYKDGILSITLPKSEKAKAVKVKVKGQ